VEPARHKKQPKILYQNTAYLNNTLRKTTFYTVVMHGPSTLRASTSPTGALCSQLSVIPSIFQSICRVKIVEEIWTDYNEISKNQSNEFVNT